MLTALKLPNFFVLGAPKAGTSALYAFLDQHPQIFMSPLKEPHYFAAEMRAENFGVRDRQRLNTEMRSLAAYLKSDLRTRRFGGLVSDWDDYLRLFQNVTAELAIGEATACYLWSPSAPGAIAARIPKAKLVVSLRNPADRAFSQYLQMVTLGRTRLSFRDQLTQSMRREPQQFGSTWPLLEFGCYYEQLARYLQVFPRSQLHISLYEDLERAPERLLAELFAFLGVDADHLVDLSARHHAPIVPRLATLTYLLKKAGVWGRLRNLAPRPLGPRLRALTVRPRAALVMDRADRAFLADYYRQDVERLAALLDRDLSAWLTPPQA